eukprot:9163743-Pyramimonas_sp.AAC.1
MALGQTVLPVGNLAFIGSLIASQYNAGIPMAARLLVPLAAGALVAKGLGDKVVSKQMRRAPAQCISKLAWAC